MTFKPSMCWSLVAAVGLALTAPASAAVVMAPVSAWATSSNGPLSIDLSFDQSGLSTTYVSGSTDFDAYLASAPSHAAAGLNSWLSLTPDNTPDVFYDFGTTVSADALALWSSDAFSPAFLSVWLSQDNMFYQRVVDALPIDAPGLAMDAFAQRFDWAPTNMRYMWLQLSCGPNDSACGIGEVALGVQPNAVPEPTSMALILAAALGLPALRRQPTRSAA